MWGIAEADKQPNSRLHLSKYRGKKIIKSCSGNTKKTAIKINVGKGKEFVKAILKSMER